MSAQTESFRLSEAILHLFICFAVSSAKSSFCKEIISMWYWKCILNAFSSYCNRNDVKYEYAVILFQRKVACLQSKCKYGRVTENIQVILLETGFASALYYLLSASFFILICSKLILFHVGILEHGLTWVKWVNIEYFNKNGVEFFSQTPEVFQSL